MNLVNPKHEFIMLLDRNIREKLNDLFYVIKLQDRNNAVSLDKQVKIEQILAYLEIVHAEIRKTSKKRKLVLVDCGAGNCYLSYLIYYYYTQIENREIEIHCIDNNEKLMARNENLAQQLNFNNMYFYTNDIENFNQNITASVVYSLHACDTATDKMMYLGLRLDAKVILSVACCQHSFKMRSKSLKPLVRYKSFRDKTLMMILDSLRALLLEQEGYKVNIFDFVSTRYTDKNTMVRAIKTSTKKNMDIKKEYENMCHEFRMKPYLEELIYKAS
jgi:16S rRNA G527 N7-methylase RsmG